MKGGFLLFHISPMARLQLKHYEFILGNNPLLFRMGWGRMACLGYVIRRLEDAGFVEEDEVQVFQTIYSHR
jgi:hypothetical protein